MSRIEERLDGLSQKICALEGLALLQEDASMYALLKLFCEGFEQSVHALHDAVRVMRDEELSRQRHLFSLRGTV